MNDELKKYLLEEDLQSQENDFFHPDKQLETAMEEAVKLGDFNILLSVSKALNSSTDPFSGKTNSNMQPSYKGQLSKSELLNARYHFVVAVAIAFRTAEAVGVPRETVHNTADFYIKKMDLLNDIPSIYMLQSEMVQTFCEEVRESKNESDHSPLVNDCIGYIQRHKNQRILIKELSDYVGYSEKWIAKKFKEEMSLSLTDYIHRQKIREACGLLRFTNQSVAEISFFMGYSNQSYFCQIFKQHTGLLPYEYRKKYTV